MSDPIEINKIYRDLAESEDFVSFDRLAGGSQEGEEHYPAAGNGAGQPGRNSLSEAEEVLRQAREERDQLLAEQEELKKKAYEEGLAEGREEGRRQGLDEYTEKIDSVTRLFDELTEDRRKLASAYESELLELIKVVVERLVCREVFRNDSVILEVLNNALEYVVDNTTVGVKLNKADLERLRGGSEESEISLDQGRRRVELIEDNSISTGGCLVVTGSGEIDATLENRRDLLFAAVDKALGKLDNQEGEEAEGSV